MQARRRETRAVAMAEAMAEAAFWPVGTTVEEVERLRWDPDAPRPPRVDPAEGFNIRRRAARAAREGQVVLGDGDDGLVAPTLQYLCTLTSPSI